MICTHHNPDHLHSKLEIVFRIRQCRLVEETKEWADLRVAKEVGVELVEGEMEWVAVRVGEPVVIVGMVGSLVASDVMVVDLDVVDVAVE